jgi:hypothetical protein
MRAIELVRIRLERAFRPFRVPDPVPYHAVLVSGFRAAAGNSFQAFNALVANSSEGRPPTRNFTIEMFDVPPGGMALTQAPVWIKPQPFASLNRAIERSAMRGATFASGTDLLAGAIRDIATKHMEVGADLIAASIPVPVDSRMGEAYVRRGRPSGAGGTFEYLSPAQGATNSRRQWY